LLAGDVDPNFGYGLDGGRVDLVRGFGATRVRDGTICGEVLNHPRAI
jgi:hypothetical protein